jgi:hypothetical protein
MSHGVLDSMSHVLAAGVLVYRIANTSLDQVVEKPVSALIAEQRLHVCGSIDAALANLSDTWQEARGLEKSRLHQGYLKTLSNVDEWRENEVLPNANTCSQNLELNQSGQILSFSSQAYRLDFADAPKRRVNWRYRMIQKESQ